MEVRLRLQKMGKKSKGNYNYRIVAIPRKTSRDTKYLEILGYYDPAKKPAVLSVNQEKVEKWISSGAQMSDTVRSLVKKAKKSKS